MLAMDENHQVLLEKAMRRVLALRGIQDDKLVVESLTAQSQEDLKKRLKEAGKELPFKIFSAYRYLSILEETGITWKNTGIPTIGSDQMISERLFQFLRDQEEILPHLTPKYNMERTFGKDETEKSLRDIYELHLKTRGMARLPNTPLTLDTMS